MILREFPSYQNIRGEFPVYSVRNGVYVAQFVCTSFIFCRGLRGVLQVCVLTLQRTMSCACGERDGYHDRFAYTWEYRHTKVQLCEVILFCVCLDLYHVVISYEWRTLLSIVRDSYARNGAGHHVRM